MKKILSATAILFISAVSFGQDNRPPEKVSIEKLMANYKNNLKKDKVPNQAIELKLLKIIPFQNEVDEKEIYFKNLLDISVDERGHIYAPDGLLCVIYEFDKDGRFIYKYQKKGQGPGELQFPIRVFFHDNKNIVLDSSQRRIIYYDKKWKYVRSFSYFLSYSPFDIDTDGLIYCNDPNGEKMIAVLDTNGKCIKRFGELPNANNPKSILNKFIARISRSGSIWVGFTALGILRKYSKAGTLEKELNFIDIGSEYAKGLKNENYENEKKGIHGSYLLIEDIAFENEDLLITGGGIVRPIFRYDSEGVLKNSYFIAPKFDSRKRCSYATKNEQGEDIFFILQREEGDTSIGVYGRKK